MLRNSQNEYQFIDAELKKEKCNFVHDNYIFTPNLQENTKNMFLNIKGRDHLNI